MRPLLYLDTARLGQIRLPIRNIVNRIRERSELRFFFIDAAQAFCQVSLDECVDVADFIVTGSHKWMGAYLPTGFGLYGQIRTRELIPHRLQQELQQVPPQDPLLHFTEQLVSARLDGHSETANLPPLIACAGATHDLLAESVGCDGICPENQLGHVPVPSDEWQPVSPSSELRSRIVLFESPLYANRHDPADAIRSNWLHAGCVVTGYDGGRARISFPANRRQ